MSHTWNKGKVNCITRWNDKLGRLCVYAILPIRAGDELLTHYGRGYWLAILHTLPSAVQREAIIAGRLSELEIFTGLEASLDVRGPPLGATSLRLTLVMERLRNGNPPFQDYWN